MGAGQQKAKENISMRVTPLTAVTALLFAASGAARADMVGG